jgi:hypothetical protein
MISAPSALAPASAAHILPGFLMLEKWVVGKMLKLLLKVA